MKVKHQDSRSREVPRAEARVWMHGRTSRWARGNRQADTCHLVEGVNTSLTLAYREFMK
jgi:hypothetical protein